MTNFIRILLPCLLGVLGSFPVFAAGPFSQSQPVNFYREVTPRDISGLALRSDGRLIAGPILKPLAGSPQADLWWDLEKLTEDIWLVGSGPDGQVLQVEVDPTGLTYRATEWADAGSNHIFVIKNLGNDLVAGGTNPAAEVVLWNAAGEELTRVSLPADSVLDLLWDKATGSLWAATGNPGSLYQIDLQQFQDSAPDLSLVERGVTLRGEVRDRNLRRLARTPSGDILAGSAPSGNLYRFDQDGSPALILLDQESGEISDILVAANGDIYATLVVATGNSTRRVIQAANVQSAEEPKESGKPETPEPTLSIMEAPPIDAFTGRSELIMIPGGTGIPQSLSSRNKMAMYRIAQYNDIFILGGGDDGEILGYGSEDRRALSFSGSDSAQINDIEALPISGDFLLLTNNPVGLSRLSFNGSGPRVARTGSLNLQTPSHLGALRFNRIRNLDPTEVEVRMRANRGRDPVEGWTPWVVAEHDAGGWRAEGLIGTHAQIEIRLPDALDGSSQLDQAELHFLPQNRQPVLRSFRIISPNFALAARPPSAAGSSTMTLGQVIGSAPNPTNADDNKARQALLSSNLVPQLGAQLVTWTVSDDDGDDFNATFSVRQAGASEWIDLAVDLKEDWFQFDRRALAEGTYFTRLTITEMAPRPEADRQVIGFATDDLVIDLTPPEINQVTVTETEKEMYFEIAVTDARSQIAGLRLQFNNGHAVKLGQPADGILDGRTEVFRTSVTQQVVATATAVEVYVDDTADNLAIERVLLP